MNSERLQLQGRLTEAQRKFAELDLAASSDVTSVRTVIDPYQEDVTKLDVDQALMMMVRLKTTVHQMRDMYRQIEKLKEALGVE